MDRKQAKRLGFGCSVYGKSCSGHMWNKEPMTVGS